MSKIHKPPKPGIKGETKDVQHMYDEGFTRVDGQYPGTHPYPSTSLYNRICFPFPLEVRPRQNKVLLFQPTDISHPSVKSPYVNVRCFV